jgi:two-component system, cell cycle sensor histidine kinase and response regulator CckA
VVDDCIEITRIRWKDEAERHGIRIEVANRVAPALRTLANPGELREVFIKLFTNAIDAMPKGGAISVRSVDDPKDERFAIEIEDTGAGMEPAVLRRVFEPFFTTKNEGGTGLGLSIVYGIMTRLGGMVEAESRPGHGSVFRLWFPRAAERRSPPTKRAGRARSRRACPAGRPGPALRVLVVEDEASVRDLFVDVLSEEGCDVDEAECARDAMALMENRIYDAVLTDLGMPDLPGWEVARFAKQKCPKTRVILSSGWGDEYSREELAQARRGPLAAQAGLPRRTLHADPQRRARAPVRFPAHGVTVRPRPALRVPGADKGRQGNGRPGGSPRFGGHAREAPPPGSSPTGASRLPAGSDSIFPDCHPP